MLFDGFTPMFAGIVGLALTAILILGAAIAAGCRNDGVPHRVLDRARPGCGAFFEFGIWPILVVDRGCSSSPASSSRAAARRSRSCATSLVDGARQALPVGIACAIVGVIIGVLTLTGAASNFAGFILDGRREAACSCRCS